MTATAKTPTLHIPSVLETLTTGVIVAAKHGEARAEYSRERGFQFTSADPDFAAEAELVMRGYLASIGIAS